MEVVFILVEPAVPANIGAAARALKTMGFDKLRLVNPANHLQDEALWLAHASREILHKAQVFNSFDEAIRDVDFTIAATARKRAVRADYYNVADLPVFLEHKKGSIHKLAVVFGKEESGLENEMIRACDIAVSIPMKKHYPSLNLAQAVMIFAYELSKTGKALLEVRGEDQNPSLYGTFREKLISLLQKLEIDQNQNLFQRILERSAALNKDDLHLVLSIMNRISGEFK